MRNRQKLACLACPCSPPNAALHVRKFCVHTSRFLPLQSEYAAGLFQRMYLRMCQRLYAYCWPFELRFVHTSHH